jgi:hypothetical protein
MVSAIKGAAMVARRVNSEDEYFAWLDRNPGGFVLNINALGARVYARVHRSDCPTINSKNKAEGAYTEHQQGKVVGHSLSELADWSAMNGGPNKIPRCKRCNPV